MNTFVNQILIAIALFSALPCAGMEQAQVAETDLIKVEIINRTEQPLEVFLQIDEAKIPQLEHVTTILPTEPYEIVLKLRSKSPVIRGIFLAHHKDANKVAQLPLSRLVFEMAMSNDELLVRPGLILFEAQPESLRELVDDVDSFASRHCKNCAYQKCELSKAPWNMTLYVYEELLKSFFVLSIGNESCPSL